MAIRPPRQRTTFKKDKKTGKVKGTTTYRAPEQEKADEQLDRYIRDNQDKKNQSAGIESILQDMPEKKAAFVRRNTRADGTLNEAAKSMLSFYADDRPEYSRGMNRLRTSSPEMMQAYARRFPVANFMMEVAPRFIPGIGALFTADRGIKANRRKQEILNTPVNRPEGGFKNFVEFFKPQMNSEQIANTEIIEGEKEPLINPQDMNIQRAVNPSFASPQDMGFLDSENIFDTEKAAIDAALTPGNVFDPVAADKRNKVDFINQVEGTDFTVENAEQRFNIDEQFERSKQKQGMIIRDEVEIEEPEENIAGQFNFTPYQDTINITGADDDQSTTGSELASANQNPEFMGLNPGMIMNPYEQSQLGEGTAKTFPPTNFATLDPNVNPEVPFSEYTDPFLMPPQSSMQSIPMNADGGSIDNYGNMSTHEKLMRMAAEMYG